MTETAINTVAPGAAIPDRGLRVDICIPTFRRPDMLARLLPALDGQRLPAGVRTRIVVADNDAATSARATVASFSRRSNVPVLYTVEARKNIAHVRNHLIALAEGDFLAFVDDDETVGTDWLAQLLDTALRYEAEVVFAPVLSELPPGTPGWLRRGGFFDRSRCATGTPRDGGAFGNVLLSRAMLARIGRGPDPAFGLTGGEDTEFFHALHAAGVRMVWCDAAVATEEVPEARTSLRWLARRRYRCGQVSARVFLAPLPPYQRAVILARNLIEFCLMSAMAPLLWPIRHLGAAALLRAIGKLGFLSILWGGRYEEYAAPQPPGDPGCRA